MPPWSSVLGALGCRAREGEPPGLPPLRGRGLPDAAHTLILAAGVLLALGMVTLFSASFPLAMRHDLAPYHYLVRQSIGVGLGLVCLLVAVCIHPRRWLDLAPPLFVAQLLLLAAVLLFGVRLNEATRWLRIGPLQFQPSELSKLAVPLLVAWFYQYRVRVPGGASIRAWWGLVAAIVATALLIAVEPDYGTGLFVLSVGGLLLLLAGLPSRVLALGSLALLPVAGVFWHWRGDVLLNRMKGLFDPGAVYQVKHSLIAIASGGVAGRGLGNGWEKTGYLPEPFNDFIFAIFAEEMGLIGVLVLLGLFAVFLHSGWRIARGCPMPALRLVAIGVTLSIVLQAVINIAVASAMAPTKGISLPFISHGSSGLVVLLLEVGILIGIARTVLSRESASTEFRSTAS